ncbi:Ig lambda chain V-1 region [Dissostichus eleginoides]|uniref:Ig lambda chain V-1 region n=1 Tax=Dissostichus eleginoides TaxID=100907 RepID=A0AAD9F347_DISEL|nr:Ig lambda chain V-1 region [Dissostichus eleginoides]
MTTGKVLVSLTVWGERVVSCTHDWTSGSELERTVRPGENITLYCDCKLSSGVYIVWYRNRSHENQPSLVLNVNVRRTDSMDIKDVMNPLPRFHFVRNSSSESYDLLIINITETDEGLYYCGTEQLMVENREQITSAHIYTHGNISTRIHVIVSCTHDWTSGSELERTVRPGDNITLYCDCKLSSGVYIEWYRNCSHENQPSLVLNLNIRNLKFSRKDLTPGFKQDGIR